MKRKLFVFFKGLQIAVVWRTSRWNLCNFILQEVDFELRTGKMSFLEFWQKNMLFGKSNYSMFHYSLRVIDEPKMSEIRIMKLYHKKSILVDIYRQRLLIFSWC